MLEDLAFWLSKSTWRQRKKTPSSGSVWWCVWLNSFPFLRGVKRHWLGISEVLVSIWSGRDKIIGFLQCNSRLVFWKRLFCLRGCGLFTLTFVSPTNFKADVCLRAVVQISPMLLDLKSAISSASTLFEIAAPSQTTTSTSSIRISGACSPFWGFISAADDFL